MNQITTAVSRKDKTISRINRVAVLGAGVMGSRIAAQMANMNVPVILFELPAEGEDKNDLSRRSITELKKSKPPAYVAKGIERFIEVANYEDDLERLAGCDLVIEAIAEKTDLKKNLYNEIAGTMGKKTILASNTSGLSINKLAESLPQDLCKRFAGTHFFNPPRYMHLVEIIPCADTDDETIISLEAFLTTTIGKGIVVAKDTPNFIANRIGVFNLLATIRHAQENKVPFEVVDQITGRPLGRPKTGTFRTMDLVGLDVLAHVTQTMVDNLPDDPWHRYYSLPEFIGHLVEKGALGQKSGTGIYADKGKQVFSLAEMDYVDADVSMDANLEKILKEKDWPKLLLSLREEDSSQARFVYRLLMDLFHYCCVHLEDIATTARDVDFAMRWGFGWDLGPFEIMQAIGWRDVTAMLDDHINNNLALTDTPLPEWVRKIDHVHDETGSWSPAGKSYLPLRSNAVYQRQLVRENVLGSRPDKMPGKTVFENDHVRMWHQGDGIAVLTFNTRMHTITEGVLDGILRACEETEKDYDALILWHPDAPFSLGADISPLVEQMAAGKLEVIEAMVEKFQQTSMALKHSRVPTVAAIQGMTLGGGCEFQMHCRLTVAAMESYIGLVEAGVGLLPAGGGLKELALKAMQESKGEDIFPAVQSAFEMTAMAKVSNSALDAKAMGLLSGNDVIVANAGEILHVARQYARALAETAAMPPRRDEPVKVAGQPGKATLMMQAINMLEGHFISEHDYRIAERIATVLTGGEVENGAMVSQDQLLKLEREYFPELVAEEKTQQRIAHTLKTGKPLRN